MMLPDLPREVSHPFDTLDQDAVLTPYQSPPASPGLDAQSLLYRCWQRWVMDMVGGFLGLLLLLVLFPLFALLIALDSPGPIFYTQERLGLCRRPFRVYKFRSMRVATAQESQVSWASACDHRITRVGRFLRATHLDELPQVLNILRGEMSLIGPRPECEVFALRMEQRSSLYRDRWLVKPGLTGWAQVKFGYGNGDVESDELEKLRFDLEYIRSRSISFDLLILLKTIVEVLTFHGR